VLAMLEKRLRRTLEGSLKDSLVAVKAKAKAKGNGKRQSRS
jgi:hypothetical protein